LLKVRTYSANPFILLSFSTSSPYLGSSIAFARRQGSPSTHALIDTLFDTANPHRLLWTDLAGFRHSQDSGKRKRGSPPRTGGRDSALSEEQFREWVNRRSRLPLAVKGHSFVMKSDNIITVDRGQFVYEEALELVRMLNSRSPLAQINANVMIWERNGTLRSIVLVLITIIIVVVIFLARR
jgi:hypothetical protein